MKYSISTNEGDLGLLNGGGHASVYAAESIVITGAKGITNKSRKLALKIFLPEIADASTMWTKEVSFLSQLLGKRNVVQIFSAYHKWPPMFICESCHQCVVLEQCPICKEKGEVAFLDVPAEGRLVCERNHEHGFDPLNSKSDRDYLKQVFVCCESNDKKFRIINRAYSRCIALERLDRNLGEFIDDIRQSIAEKPWSDSDQQQRAVFLLLLHIAIEAANGIYECHSQGILHLDISDDNIMVRLPPGYELHELIQPDKHHMIEVKLIDFGISDTKDTVEQTTFMEGKPTFAAPEKVGYRRRDSIEWHLSDGQYVELEDFVDLPYEKGDLLAESKVSARSRRAISWNYVVDNVERVKRGRSRLHVKKRSSDVPYPNPKSPLMLLPLPSKATDIFSFGVVLAWLFFLGDSRESEIDMIKSLNKTVSESTKPVSPDKHLLHPANWTLHDEQKRAIYDAMALPSGEEDIILRDDILTIIARCMVRGLADGVVYCPSRSLTRDNAARDLGEDLQYMKRQLLKLYLAKDEGVGVQSFVVREELERLRSDNEIVEDQLERLRSDNETFEDQLERLRSDNETFEDQLERLRSDNETLEDQVVKTRKRGRLQLLLVLSVILGVQCSIGISYYYTDIAKLTRDLWASVMGTEDPGGIVTGEGEKNMPSLASSETGKATTGNEDIGDAEGRDLDEALSSSDIGSSDIGPEKEMATVECPINTKKVENESVDLVLCVDTYEVTLEEYIDCIHDNRCDTPMEESSEKRYDKNGNVSAELGKALTYHADNRHGLHRHPINGVSFKQARTYCEMKGGDLLDKDIWARLATSGADGTGGAFPWGSETIDETKSNTCMAECEWWGKKKNGQYQRFSMSATNNDNWKYTSDVDAFENDKNADGIIGLAGNVSEWVKDKDNKAFVCGGSWSSVRPQDLVECREGTEEEIAVGTPFLGFRCVKGAEPD